MPRLFSYGRKHPAWITGQDKIVFFLKKLKRKAVSHQDLIAFAISGATDTVLTALSRVSVARTASTPER